MAGKKTFTKPINDLLQMARQSLDTLGNANQIVYGGVQKLADAELKALNDYYKAAVSSLKRARGEKDLKSTAQKQADLLQEAVSKLIGNARASLSVVADARDELAKLVKGNAAGAPLSAARLEKAMAPAVKALEKIKAEAKKAGEKAGLTVKTAKKDIKAEVAKVEKALKSDVKAVKKDVKAKSKTIEKAVKTEVKAAKKVAKAVEKKVVKTAKVVEKKVEASVAEAKKAVARAVPTPSPNSRASRATSAAKKVVTQVTETASAAVDAAKATVDNASAAVSAAVTTAVDAVKSQG